MFELPYSLTKNEDNPDVLVVLIDGKMVTTTSENPRYTDILSILLTPITSQEEVDYLYDLMTTDIIEGVGSAMRQLSEKISYEDGEILYNGEPVHGQVVESIKHALLNDGDYEPLVKFLERIEKNPSMVSRNEAYAWIEQSGLTITEEGMVIGYKGLDSAGDSIHAGGAYVNGEWVSGHIPNTIGAVISMDRRDVNDNRSDACSYGLHVGTYEYANSFGQGIVATVTVDPANIVSVPSDANCTKMRVCEYKVVRLEVEKATELKSNITIPEAEINLWMGYVADDEEDYEEEDYEEGYY